MSARVGTTVQGSGSAADPVLNSCFQPCSSCPKLVHIPAQQAQAPAPWNTHMHANHTKQPPRWHNSTNAAENRPHYTLGVVDSWALMATGRHSRAASSCLQQHLPPRAAAHSAAQHTHTRLIPAPSCMPSSPSLHRPAAARLRGARTQRHVPSHRQHPEPAGQQGHSCHCPPLCAARDFLAAHSASHPNPNPLLPLEGSPQQQAWPL